MKPNWSLDPDRSLFRPRYGWAMSAIFLIVCMVPERHHHPPLYSLVDSLFVTLQGYGLVLILRSASR